MIKNNLKKDESFGIIPLRFQDNKSEVFIIQHKNGHWGFPKGHKNDVKENSKLAAQRELTEETGLTVKEYTFDEPFVESYECISHGQHVFKTVTYFAATVEGTIRLCPSEISDGKWIRLEEAYIYLTFEESKIILSQLERLLSSYR